MWAARAGLMGPTLGRTLSARRAAALARSVSALDDPATQRRPEERRRVLRLAFLALSLGLSGAEARTWMAGRRLPRRETDDAARLTELVTSAAALPAGGRRAAWRWVLDAGALAGEGAHLLARRGSPALAARLARLARQEPRRVRVGGEDVMRWLGIAAGPRVGALLRELALAAACGEVKNRREARHWLSGQVRESPRPAIIPAH